MGSLGTGFIGALTDRLVLIPFPDATTAQYRDDALARQFLHTAPGLWSRTGQKLPRPELL